MTPNKKPRRHLMPIVLLILLSVFCVCGVSCRAILDSLTDAAVSELESKLDEWINGTSEPDTTGDLPLVTEPADPSLPTDPDERPTETAPTDPETEALTVLPAEPPTESPTETDTGCPHSFSAWTEETAPTCTQGGSHWRVCRLCGTTEEEPVPPNGHTVMDIVRHLGKTGILPERDVTTTSCSVCGTLLSRSVAEFDTPKDTEDLLRSLLTEGLAAGEETIDISAVRIPYTVDGCHIIERIINEIYFSCGWVMFDGTYSMRGSGYVSKVLFTYADPPAVRARLRMDAEARINEIIAAVPEGLSPLEITLFLHDYLVEHFVYDETYGIHDMCGMLTSGTGVCQAYTQLYIELLGRFGIASTYARSEELNHIWNVVAIDGMTYHVDVTWDDPLGNKSGHVRHTYFMVDDEEMHESHGAVFESSETCDDLRFCGWWVQDVTSCAVFTGSEVYAVHDRRLVQAVSLTDETLEEIYTYDKWRLYGTNQYYNSACYAGLGTYGGRLYTNTYDRILCIDPATGKADALPIVPEGGYFYGLSLDGNTLTYLLATDEARDSAVGLFTVSID